MVLDSLRVVLFSFFFFQAEDGIRDLVRSRGLGDVYKRQPLLEKVIDRIDTIPPKRYISLPLEI